MKKLASEPAHTLRRPDPLRKNPVWPAMFRMPLIFIVSFLFVTVQLLPKVSEYRPQVYSHCQSCRSKRYVITELVPCNCWLLTSSLSNLPLAKLKFSRVNKKSRWQQLSWSEYGTSLLSGAARSRICHIPYMYDSRRIFNLR